MATACSCSSALAAGLGHQAVEAQAPLSSSPLSCERLSLMSSTVLGSSSWCKVSSQSSATTDSAEVLFRPSVLSFSSFVYVGRTLPLPSSIHIRMIHPFQGIFMFCDWNTPCLASKNLSKETNCATGNDIRLHSEKNDCTVGNGLSDKNCECVYTDREYDYVEVSDNEESEEDDEEEEWDSEVSGSDCAESDDDDDWASDRVVEFESSCRQAEVGAKCQVPLPSFLCHTSSYSSEESGFCDQLHSEWSDEDDGDNECNFDEGLWLNFEKQACFTDVPIRNGKHKKPCKQTEYHCTKPSHVDIPSTNKHKTANKHTSTQITAGKYCTHDDNGTKPSVVGSSHQRRVSFKPDSELVAVRYIVAWKYAYRACRKGPWEQFAADRERFSKRIQAVDSILTPCLLKKK